MTLLNKDNINQTKTRTDKLDSLLNGLLFIDTILLKGKPVKKKITIEFLCETLKLDCEKWEMLSLKNELITEGHMLESEGELRITESGKIFITRQKGFKNLEKREKEDELIRIKTIEKFKYDKFSFWLSIIAIAFAGLSLLMTILKP